MILLWQKYRNSAAEFLIFQIEGKEDGVQVICGYGGLLSFYRQALLWQESPSLRSLHGYPRPVWQQEGDQTGTVSWDPKLPVFHFFARRAGDSVRLPARAVPVFFVAVRPSVSAAFHWILQRNSWSSGGWLSAPADLDYPFYCILLTHLFRKHPIIVYTSKYFGDCTQLGWTPTLYDSRLNVW